MIYDKIKEKLTNSGYIFIEANNGLMEITKSSVLNTSIITFISFVDFGNTKTFKVKYKCTRTNNFFSESTYENSGLDIEYFINEHKDFIDSIKTLDKIYSCTFEDLMNSYIG